MCLVFWRHFSSPPLFIYACLKWPNTYNWLAIAALWMLFTLDRLPRLLSLLVSPEPNQPREMGNLEQSLFISQHVTLVCLWTSAFDVSPAFFIDIHPVFGPEILCYFSSSEASSSSYSHPFLHLEGQKAPENDRPPPHRLTVVGHRGAEAVVSLWLLWLSYSWLQYKLQKYASLLRWKLRSCLPFN